MRSRELMEARSELNKGEAGLVVRSPVKELDPSFYIP